MKILKKPDNLEVGDEFTAFGANHKFEVLGIAYDKYYNQKTYFARQLDGKYKGYTTTVLVQAINKVKGADE